MNAREYNRSDKWSAHYKNNRITRRSGETPLHISDPDLNNRHDLHEKYMGTIEHDQTQVEIPIVEMLTQSNYERQTTAKNLISEAETILDDYEETYEEQDSVATGDN